MKNVKFKDHIFENYKISENGFVFGYKDKKLTIYRNGRGEFVKMYYKNKSRSFRISELLAYTFLDYKESKLKSLVNTNLNVYDNKTKLSHIKIMSSKKYASEFFGLENPKIAIYNNNKYYNYIVGINGEVVNVKKDFKLKIQTGTYLFALFNTHTILIHRLLYNTYKGDLNPKLEINHIDGNKYNNDLDNLEQVNSKRNANHAVENGLIKSLGYYDKKLLHIIEGLYMSGEGKYHIKELLDRDISYNTIRHITNKYINSIPDIRSYSKLNLRQIEKLFLIRSNTELSFREIQEKYFENVSSYTLNNIFNSQKYKKLVSFNT